MLFFLLELPVALMVLSIVGTTVLVALAIVEILYRSPFSNLKLSFRLMLPPLGGAMMAGYVIFSALVASTIWHDKDFAQKAVHQEARSLGFLKKIVDAKQHPEFGLRVSAYAKMVTQEEWKTMSDGIENASARRILDDLHLTVLSGLPGISDVMRQSLLATLKDAEVARQNRLTAATDNIPGEVWLTVMLTALVVLVFSAMAHLHDLKAARIMATLFGVMIGSMMFSIIAVDRPFLGKVSVSSAPIAEIWVQR